MGATTGTARVRVPGGTHPSAPSSLETAAFRGFPYGLLVSTATDGFCVETEPRSG